MASFTNYSSSAVMTDVGFLYISINLPNSINTKSINSQMQEKEGDISAEKLMGVLAGCSRCSWISLLMEKMEIANDYILISLSIMGRSLKFRDPLSPLLVHLFITVLHTL